MRIIGYHIQGETIANSDGEICRQSPYFEFLLQEKGECLKVFYHLDFNVACLLRMILENWEIATLLRTSKFRKNSYELNYIPHKWFSIKSNGLYSGFSDMSQYLDWHIDESKEIDYCLKKAKEAQETGYVVYRALLKAGVVPKSLTSPVGAFEKSVMCNMDLPTCEDYPDEVSQYAYECCHGSWLEVFKKGHWNTLYDYDISAAYPYFTSQLIDIRNGEWIRSAEFKNEAQYGYCKGLVKIFKTPSPIIYSVTKDINYNPVGEWECFLTKAEVDFIRKYEIGEFDLKSGWFFIPEHKVYPLKQTIQELYTVRETLTGLEKEVVKRIITGLWGKFGEVWKDKTLGTYFNPVWMSEVECATRLEVARFIYENNLPVLSIAVDGIVSEIPAPEMRNNGMGSWRLSSLCPGFVISSGVVALKDVVSNKDFSLRYDWLYDQISENPTKSEYTMKKLSPVTIAKAVTQDKFDKLGQLEEITKYVDVEYEVKRDYTEVPKCGRDLLTHKYESFAFDVSRIQIEEFENDDINRDSDRLSGMPVLEGSKT